MNTNKIKKITAIIASCATVFSCMASYAPVYAASNMLSNGTFEGSKSGWDSYAQEGGQGSSSVQNGKFCLNVTNTGSCNYAVQAFCTESISLKQGVRYKLSYDISSTANRKIEVMIQENGGSYTCYTWKEVSLTSSEQHVEQTFTMSAADDNKARLVFNCGNQSGSLGSHTIYIDNVVLECLDDNVSSGGGGNTNVPAGDAGILLNQVGFYPNQSKSVVFRGVSNESEFSVVDANSGAVVYTGTLSDKKYNSGAKETDAKGDFSSVTQSGTYYITCGNMPKSYTFTINENVYDSLIDSSVRMLYLQRCGVQVNDNTFSHPACHTSKAKVYNTNNYIDVSGGWHDAGDYGRYVVPGAKTIADLLYAYQASPAAFSDSIGIPESGNGVPDILDEARFELEWMLKMQESSGGVYHKVSCRNFPGFVMPQNETAELIVTPVSTTATADFCAAMAMAYEFYKGYDAAFANKCLDAAKNAWGYLESHPNTIFNNPGDISTGAYDDTSDRDERYWAAAQMYRATGEQQYLTKFRSMTHYNGLDWANVGSYGDIAYLTMEGVSTSDSLYNSIKSSLISQANSYKSAALGSAYGSPIYDFYWGSNMTVANAGILLGLAYDLTGDSDYLNAGTNTMNYLLGSNPLDMCFVTGFGTVSPQHPHHRPSIALNKSMPGMLVGGVNQNLEDDVAKQQLASAPIAKCYIDDKESYSTNEVTIYWNSPLTYALALIDTKLGSVSDQPQQTTTTTTTTTEETTTTTTTTTEDQWWNTTTETTTTEYNWWDTTTETTTTTVTTEDQWWNKTTEDQWWNTTSSAQETTTTTTETTTTAASTEYPWWSTTTTTNYGDIQLQGDIDRDGSVSMTDAVVLQKYLLGRRYLYSESKRAADLNNDGRVNIYDLVLLRKHLMGK